MLALSQLLIASAVGAAPVLIHETNVNGNPVCLPAPAPCSRLEQAFHDGLPVMVQVHDATNHQTLRYSCVHLREYDNGTDAPTYTCWSAPFPGPDFDSDERIWWHADFSTPNLHYVLISSNGTNSDANARWDGTDGSRSADTLAVKWFALP